MLNTVSKIRGQVKNPGYPQPEGLLGECMIRHGKELGGESNFGEGTGLGGRVAQPEPCPAASRWGGWARRGSPVTPAPGQVMPCWTRASP